MAMPTVFEQHGVTYELDVRGQEVMIRTGRGRFDVVIEEYASIEDAQLAAELVQQRWESAGFKPRRPAGTSLLVGTSGPPPARAPGLLLDSSGQPFRKPAKARPAPLRTRYPEADGIDPKLVPLLKKLDTEADWFASVIEDGTLVGAEIDSSSLSALLSSRPATQRLRRLEVVVVPADEDLEVAVKRLQSKPPTALESLTLARFHKTLETFLATELDVTGLLPKLKNLRHLDLGAGKLHLGTFALPELKSLHVRTAGLSSAALSSILSAELGGLERLELWFGAAHRGGTCNVDDLAPLLTGERVPALTHLALKTCEFADDLCPRLLASPLLARLSVLEISYGMLSDRGIETLVRGADQLRSLQLIVKRGAATTQGYQRLAGSGLNVNVEHESAPNTTVEHFVPVGPADQFIYLDRVG